MNARQFYICQWYRDINAIGRKATKKKVRSSGRKNKKSGDTSSEEESSEEEEEEEDEVSNSTKSALYRLKERRKDELLVKIPPFGMGGDSNKSQVRQYSGDACPEHILVAYANCTTVELG